jgi:hypothetical protein
MSTPGGSGPELRIGDAEREAAVSALGEHYAAGRLSKEEYDERASQAYQARTRSALWPLFADLPRPEAERPPAPPTGGRTRTGHQGWRLGAALLPMLVVFFVVSLLVGHPVFLLLILGLLFWKATHFWGHGPRHPHHHGWR